MPTGTAITFRRGYGLAVDSGAFRLIGTPALLLGPDNLLAPTLSNGGPFTGPTLSAGSTSAPINSGSTLTGPTLSDGGTIIAPVLNPAYS